MKHTQLNSFICFGVFFELEKSAKSILNTTAAKNGALPFLVHFFSNLMGVGGWWFGFYIIAAGPTANGISCITNWPNKPWERAKIPQFIHFFSV